MMTILLLIAGLALLVIGAELLVRGASQLAATAGIPPLIIGLTVVAFGTSAPEFAVSANSALTGQASLALGNVVGSNILNVLLILGLSALICPLVVSQQLIRVDVPLMIVASLLVLLMAWDGVITGFEGSVMGTGLLTYIGFLIYFGRKTKSPAIESEPKIEASRPHAWIVQVGLVAAGLALLVWGSKWLVDSAVTLAQSWGVSESVIGLTIVAGGTSLPEVVTSVVASIKGERDIAVGNVVGSNLFNLLGVLGFAAVLAPGGIEVAPSVITFDIPIMIAVAFVCLPIFFTGGIISRWEGGFLLSYYVAYTAFLLLTAARHSALPAFQVGMAYFVIPLTVLTLIVTTVQALRRKSADLAD